MNYSGERVKTEAIADMTRMKCLLHIARQMEEFDEFYDIREGDGMYLSPEDRVAVW